MLEKIPEVDRFNGISGSSNCPFGKATFKNFSSFQFTQPRDLESNIER